MFIHVHMNICLRVHGLHVFYLGNMTDRRDYLHYLFSIDKSHINPFYDLFCENSLFSH